MVLGKEADKEVHVVHTAICCLYRAMADPKKGQPTGFVSSHQFTTQDATPRQTTVIIDTDTATADDARQADGNRAAASGADGVPRDEGVHDATWAEIQQSVIEEERRIAEEERLAEEQRKRERELALLEKQLRLEKEEAKRRAIEAQKRRLEEARRRAAEAARQRQEQARKEAARLAAAQRIGNCPAGYTWVKVSGDYRCQAGGHYVS